MTLDDIVLTALNRLWPGHPVPDKVNRRSDGSSYKAPDHDLMDGLVLIERKSLNPQPDKTYPKMRDITAGQGRTFNGVGMVSSTSFFGALPDPSAAHRKLVGYRTNRMLNTIRKANSQFLGYCTEKSSHNSTNILVISDHDDNISSTAAIEYAIGKFILDKGMNELDCVIYVRNPSMTLDRPGQYWFLSLVQTSKGPAKSEIAIRFSYVLHASVATHPSLVRQAKFRNAHFRPLTL